MDLDESERVEVRSEEVGHGGLETEDGLVGGCLVVRVASISVEWLRSDLAGYGLTLKSITRLSNLVSKPTLAN